MGRAPLRSEYLSQFHPAPSPQVPSFVSALTERMACRVLVFFVRHAALVRPLSNDGKLRLAKVRPRQITTVKHAIPNPESLTNWDLLLWCCLICTCVHVFSLPLECELVSVLILLIASCLNMASFSSARWTQCVRPERLAIEKSQVGTRPLQLLTAAQVLHALSEFTRFIGTSAARPSSSQKCCSQWLRPFVAMLHICCNPYQRSPMLTAASIVVCALNYTCSNWLQ